MRGVSASENNRFAVLRAIADREAGTIDEFQIHPAKITVTQVLTPPGQKMRQWINGRNSPIYVTLRSEIARNSTQPWGLPAALS